VPMPLSRPFARAVLWTIVLATPLVAQRRVESHAFAARSLDLTVNDVGISIGNSKRVRGLRINWRDEGLERVDGVTHVRAARFRRVEAPAEVPESHDYR